MKKRILSILLLCCMVLTLLPTTAFAAETGAMDNIPAKFDVEIDLCNRTSDINIKDSKTYYIYSSSSDPDFVWTKKMKKINIGVKKALGLWVDKPYRKPADMRCLCVKCLESYKNSPNYIVKRLDPFAKAKDKCDKCQSYGYDYLVIERSKEG